MHNSIRISPAVKRGVRSKWSYTRGVVIMDFDRGLLFVSIIDWKSVTVTRAQILNTTERVHYFLHVFCSEQLLVCTIKTQLLHERCWQVKLSVLLIIIELVFWNILWHETKAGYNYYGSYSRKLFFSLFSLTCHMHRTQHTRRNQS